MRHYLVKIVANIIFFFTAMSEMHRLALYYNFYIDRIISRVSNLFTDNEIEN